MRFDVARYYEDMRRILQSKFDCRFINVDDVLQNTALNMLVTEDYDPSRGGPTTYIFYKLRTTYLNLFQKKNKSKEVPLEDNQEAFTVPYEKTVDEFQFTMQKATELARSYYQLLTEGHNKKEAGEWLGLEPETSEHLYRHIKETRREYQAA